MQQMKARTGVSRDEESIQWSMAALSMGAAEEKTADLSMISVAGGLEVAAAMVGVPVSGGVLVKGVDVCSTQAM